MILNHPYRERTYVPAHKMYHFQLYNQSLSVIVIQLYLSNSQCLSLTQTGPITEIEPKHFEYDFVVNKLG